MKFLLLFDVFFENDGNQKMLETIREIVAGISSKVMVIFEVHNDKQSNVTVPRGF